MQAASRHPMMQKGFFLLEGLIAILIFSLGILALMGLQAAAIKHTSAAKFRADASFLAGQAVSAMWSANQPDIPVQFGGGGPAFIAWNTAVQNSLPGGAGAIALTTPRPNSVNAVVTVAWQAPGEPAHRYVTQTEINKN